MCERFVVKLAENGTAHLIDRTTHSRRGVYLSLATAEREASRLNTWAETMAGRGTVLGRALVALPSVIRRAPVLGV